MTAAAEAGPNGAAPPAPAPRSPINLLQELLKELPGLLSDRVELLSLELHRAGLALSQIVALVLAAAVLAATAWLALWVGVTGWLVLTMGVHWAVAALVVLSFNLCSAGILLARVRGLAGLLALPATQRHLMVGPPHVVTPEPQQPTPTAVDHGRA